MAQGDRIGHLSCRCSRKRDREFIDQGDAIVCCVCGTIVRCKPPLMDIFESVCLCSTALPGVTTLVVDSVGNIVCTVCGRINRT